MSNNKSKKNRRKRITYKKFTSRGGKSQRTARYHKGYHSNIKRASAQCETKRRHNEHPSSRARFGTFTSK
jgi:hypothetical protein